MKRLLFVAMITILWLPAKSQALDFLDLPVINELWIEFKDTVGTNIFITSPGTMQTWNYSNVFNVHDTIQYLQQLPSSAPSTTASLFPQATSVTTGTSQGDYTFYKSDITGMYIVGKYFSAGFDVFGNQFNIVNYNNDFLFLPVPFDIGNVVQNTANYSFTYPDSSLLPDAQVRITYVTFQDMEADAQGSLTTPLGSYNSVIRIKEMITNSVLIEIDSFSTGNFTLLTDIQYPTTYAYKWIKNGPNCLVMTAVLNELQQVTEASYYTSSGLVGDQLQLGAANDFNVFPNPIKKGDRIVIQQNNKHSGVLMISDLSGREIYSYRYTQNQTLEYDAHLRAGVYLIKLLDDSQAVEIKKLIVVD